MIVTVSPMTMPAYERLKSARRDFLSSAQQQRSSDNRTDALRCRLGLLVADVGVAQRHARLLVAEQAGDQRKRYALQHGVARERMSVMNSRVLDPGFLSQRTSEREIVRKRSLRMQRRGKDAGACRTPLLLNYRPSRRVQNDPSRPGVGVDEVERVSFHVLPSQGHDLAPPASRSTAEGG